jgi:cyclic di-GMP phosphodiesterase
MIKDCILVVDDDEATRKPVSILLEKKGYQAIVCGSADEALSKLAGNRISAILADIDMPRTSGMDLLDQVNALDLDIPVILMTGASKIEHAMDAFGKGAFNFITKPFKSENLLKVLEKAVRHRSLIEDGKNYRSMLEDLARSRTSELNAALMANRSLMEEITRRLITIAEFKDPESGAHIVRMGLYAGEISRALGMSAAFTGEMEFAAPMHDIGKVAIPDTVLFKPGRLTPEEHDVMKSHTEIGSRLLSGSKHAGIRMAAGIALTHHERMDGSGYPGGLKGDDIPLEGRIVFLCDCYDAIRCRRPYKPPFSHGEAVSMMTGGSDDIQPVKHFDRAVLDAFIKAASAFEAIFNDNRD